MEGQIFFISHQLIRHINSNELNRGNELTEELTEHKEVKLDTMMSVFSPVWKFN